jgi:hypothetical protein
MLNSSQFRRRLASPSMPQPGCSILRLEWTEPSAIRAFSIFPPFEERDEFRRFLA